VLVGHVDVASRLSIAGWAADSDRPQEAVQVRLLANGRAMRVTADITRDDLRTVFPGSTGQYGFLFDAGVLPLSPFVDQSVRIAFAPSGAQVPGGDFVIPAMGDPLPLTVRAGKRVPIVVTTTGRTGSSLLMARLSRHPGIVVAHKHPHELKLLSYYAAALRTLISEADMQRSTNPETMVAAANRFFIGSNPYNNPEEQQWPLLGQFWTGFAPRALGNCFAGLIDGYYDRVAQQTEKPDANFFAEKIGPIDIVREAASFMFGPVNEILLVRDPRDIICSANVFWKWSFDASLKALRNQFLAMNRPRAESGLRQHVMRYEDLLLRPRQAMTELLDFLGLTLSGKETADDLEADIFSRHGTRATPGETIGRWRQELTAEQARSAADELGPYIEKYGYPNA
jgi:hypothetical protein